MKTQKQNLSIKDRNKEVEKHLALVTSIVNKIGKTAFPSEDMFQVGVIGLIKAVDKFDESKGFTFSTYATPLIKGEILHFLRDKSSLLAGGSKLKRLNINKCSKEELEERDNFYYCKSLNYKLYEDNTIELIDDIPYVPTENSTDLNDLKKLLSILNAKRYFVLTEHYLNDKKLVEIAKSFNPPKNPATLSNMNSRSIRKLQNYQKLDNTSPQPTSHRI